MTRNLSSEEAWTRQGTHMRRRGVPTIPFPPIIHHFHHYAGFPFSPYALKYFGQYNIDRVLNNIRICEHGILCDKCCFIYDGPQARRLLDGVKSTRYAREVYLPPTLQTRCTSAHLSLRRFIVQLCFGESTNLRARMLCEDERCVNIHHFVFRYFFVDEPADPFRYVNICQHGRTCAICCWEWISHFSKNGQGVPIPRVANADFTKSKADVKRVLALIHLQLPLTQQMRVDVSCQNFQCVNFHHIRVRTLREFALEKKYTWKASAKRASAKRKMQRLLLAS